MGDVVIRRSDGQELRFTHADFVGLGKPRLFGLQIAFSKEWDTMTGLRQIDVVHSDPTKTEKEEKLFGGHNAYYGDITGTTQMFASTKDRRSCDQTMILPEGRLSVTHEWGEHGSIEGQATISPEQIESGLPKETQRTSLFANIFGRRK